MRKTPLSGLLAIGLLVAGCFTGCAAQQKKQEPPPPQPKAAAKPAPAKSGNCATAYYPTGEKATSVLMLEKCAPAEVVAGAPFDYTITAMNISGASLEDVVVNDTIPTGFSVAGSEPSGANMGSGKMSWNLGNMGPGDSKTIKVKGSATAKGVLNNCATASYTMAACISVNVVQPSLAITKSAPSDVVLCDPIPVKIVVTNTGSGAATNVTVTDNFPAGLATADGKTNFSQSVGTLASGQSKEINLSLKASKTGSFQNTAMAAADGNLKAQSQTTTTVVHQPKLTIDVECPGETRFGLDVTYKVTVKNVGDSACDTTVSSTIPGGSTFVKADNGGTFSAGKVVWNVGSLKANESKSATYTVKPSSIGSLSVTASASCACADSVSDSCSTPIKGTPDLVTLLDDSEGVVAVSSNHEYRYEVGNQGQVDLTNIQVVVTLPEGLEYVSSDSPVAPKVDGRKLTWTAANALKPGERRTYRLIVKATKAGEYLVISETTCNELKSSVRDDEVTVFVQ